MADSILPQPELRTPIEFVQGGGGTGEISSKEISSGEKSSGEKSSGEISSKEISSNEISSGEKSSGEKSSGEISSGENSTSEISSGENSTSENTGSENSSNESVKSVNTAIRATANIDHLPVPDISNAQLKTLTNGLTVRYVTPSIKDDIMNLRFIKGEKELFDNHLKFNTPFILKFISEDSPVKSSDENVLKDLAPASQNTPVPPISPIVPETTVPLASQNTPVLPTPPIQKGEDEPKVPKTNKEKFYDFWEIYINEDGTDGFHRMTGRKANTIKAYLDTIQKAHETYLLKGTLRYLQREENPAAFEKLYEEPEDSFFDTFFEMIKVPSDIKKPVEEKKEEVKPEESKFTKLLQDMKIKESDVKGHFTSIETAYTACMNIIDSNAREQFNKLGGYVDTVINKHKNEIVKILIEIESIVGESKKAIVDLERKLLDKPDENVSKELESTKKFIEESNKYIDSIRRYRNAAVLPENVIRAFQAIKPGVRGVLSKKQLFDELKEKYKYAVRLISDPTLKERERVVEEEDEEDEEYDDNSVSVGSQASGNNSVAEGPGTVSTDDSSSLQSVKPRPHVAEKAKAAAIGRAILAASEPQITRSGRVVKPTAPGGRGPRSRKTRKARKAI